MSMPEVINSTKERQKIRPNISGAVYRPVGERMDGKPLTNQRIHSLRIDKGKGKILTAHKIWEATGIRERSVAASFETPLFMGQMAAIEALNGSKDVDIVVVSSSYPTGINLSRTIINDLNLPAQYNMDVYAACSGFVRGLVYLKENEREFDGAKVLMVGTEKYSPTLHPLTNEGIKNDPNMAATIFSDGAAALYFQLGKDIKLLHAQSYPMDDKLKNHIMMPIEADKLVHPYIEENVPNDCDFFYQRGPYVYRAVLDNIPGVIRDVVRGSGLRSRDIELAITHQASGRVMTGLSREVPEYQIYYDMEEGNWSSAAIIKALSRAISFGEVGVGDILALIGFGAGMRAEGAVVKLAA